MYISSIRTSVAHSHGYIRTATDICAQPDQIYRHTAVNCITSPDNVLSISLCERSVQAPLTTLSVRSTAVHYMYIDSAHRIADLKTHDLMCVCVCVCVHAVPRMCREGREHCKVTVWVGSDGRCDK